jgi:type II secretory pathway component GspD/PulD (secretin)
MRARRPAVILISSLALCLAACRASESSAPSQSSPSSAAGASAKVEPLLPAPSGPLDVSAAAGAHLSLDELLARLSKLTGVTFSMDERVRGLLLHSSVALSQEKRVPVADVYPWVESILQQNGYSLAVLKSGESPLVGVYSPIGGSPSQPPSLAVDADHMDECRMHPALLVTTTVHLPHTDVRTLGNSLRAITSDPSAGSGIIPVGNTNSVILTGTGRNVADLVAMLRTIDEQSRSDLDAPAQAAAPARQ